MTPRLDLIEANLLAVAEMQRASAEKQAIADEKHNLWFEKFERSMEGLVRVHELNQKTLATLTESISKYVDESNVRVKRLIV